MKNFSPAPALFRKRGAGEPNDCPKAAKRQVKGHMAPAAKADYLIRIVIHMITVSRLNNEQILINPHLIETIEATPDTVVTLTTGKKFVVKEPVPEIVKRIVQYRQTIGTKLFSDANEVS